MTHLQRGLSRAKFERREGDSNPRGLWPNGFQDRRIRPLCHPSELGFYLSAQPPCIINPTTADNVTAWQGYGSCAPVVWAVSVSTGRDSRTGRYGQPSKSVHGWRRVANQAAGEPAPEVAKPGSSSFEKVRDRAACDKLGCTIFVTLLPP